MTEDGQTVHRKINMKHGNERGKFDIGSHVHAEQWENICSLEHSKLSMYYQTTSPTAILSIAPCGFAGCIGAGCDDMLRVWHQQPEGSYHADEPFECVGKYPHSLETAQPHQAPAEFFTNDPDHRIGHLAWW